MKQIFFSTIIIGALFCSTGCSARNQASGGECSGSGCTGCAAHEKGASCESCGCHESTGEKGSCGCSGH